MPQAACLPALPHHPTLPVTSHRTSSCALSLLPALFSHFRNAKRELPQYIPVASELYSFLQDNCMPTTLPDGRTESPGVLRIYLASMVILAVFYLCSAVLGLILKSVATILRAVGIMGEWC
jgi:hypothetical protein